MSNFPHELQFARPTKKFEQLPTRVTADGKRVWEDEAGRIDRDGAPALISADGRLEYWRHGLRHREDGPAVIYPDGRQEYWLLGFEVSLDFFDLHPSD